MNSTTPEFTTTIVDTGFTPADEGTKKLYNEVRAFAKQGQPIMIFGPTGAGKEFLARHYYSNFVKSEFYRQWKENWPSKYKDIRTQYSGVYSGENLDIFLKSMKPGVFQSINSAAIYPDLAESILFGTIKGTFTDSSTRPGLLEIVKYGVLFMDEIGELPRHIQAKLLRAVDSEISEGIRLSGSTAYSLKDLIIITATNQPREMIRNDLYYKMGIEVNIKGIDERPEDVIRAIPYFISRAIGKRKDYGAVNGMFGISGIQDPSKLSEAEEIKNFAREQAESIKDEILLRKWPGNFRALRVAIEASIFRIESAHDLTRFTERFRNNLKNYIKLYSDDRKKPSVLIERTSSDNTYPTFYPDMDRQKSLQDINEKEKGILALFLSSTHDKGFIRSELVDHYKIHQIKQISEPHIRNRIKKLLTVNFLKKQERGKSTRYKLTDYFLSHIKNDDIFALPDINNEWSERNEEIADLSKRISAIQRIYIQAGARYGKTSFIAMFCQAMHKQYNFYYYALGEGGMDKFFRDIFRRLQAKDNNLDPVKFLQEVVNDIQPFLENIFDFETGKEPVLILDNAHLISDPGDKSAIANLSKKLQKVILILIGDKMDNAFLTDFTEFPLQRWDKHV
jgi:Sigma-54 interaction domain